MRHITIAETPSFRVVSFGNGWGYTFTDTVNRRSVWFQGEGAEVFRDEWEKWEKAHPNKPQEEILGELWSEYEVVSESDGGEG